MRQRVAYGSLGRVETLQDTPLAVVEGVVREVYEIEALDQAWSTPYASREASRDTTHGRWEFVGSVVASIRQRC